MCFEGKVLKIKKYEVVFKFEDTKYFVPFTDIFSLQFEDVENQVYTNYLKAQSAEPELTPCLKARMDAKALHGKEVGHVVLGFLFGPFAIIGTAFASPNPLNGRHTPNPLNGRHTLEKSPNKDLFANTEYLKCYKKKAKERLIGMEFLGWGAFLVLVGIANA